MKKLLMLLASLLAAQGIVAETKIELGCFDGTEVIAPGIVGTLCALGIQNRSVSIQEIEDAISALQVRGVMLFVCQGGDQFFLKEEHFLKFEEYCKGDRLIVLSETPAEEILELIHTVIPDILWDEGQGLTASMIFTGDTLAKLFGEQKDSKDEDLAPQAPVEKSSWYCSIQ
jgi:hypothetical protein